MAPGCVMCNNLYIYRYFNTNRRCPCCYLLVACHFVFESLVQLFRGHAMKTVVLGGPGPQKVVVQEDKLNSYGDLMQPNVHGMETWFGSSSCGPIERAAKGETLRGELAKAKPRKTVSINHTVEFIDDYLSNKKRKRKSMEQWPSMDIEDDEIKPLRSILKVGKNQI